ncbi:FG-GAP repeat domain-containing protein [Streptomyces sp. NBC_01264]|uniref:FG-GAP repeat domain-containing protein n=1 Tax=Streptomyces sp. NBC_01264 TaxID=2903804 RepID=UPI00225B75C1|nr:VCBS repeat-containing protein [Streptomyces sp. NBC_01264]MCX4779084.1 VCBS repeat-containing protein [Streptomyces sp. NBC_01264]
MNFSRHMRPGRLAVCTAIVLATGVTLAGTASATGDPSHGTVARPTPKAEAPIGPLPAKGKKASAGLRAAGLAALRFDADGDNIPDSLYQAINDEYFVNSGGAAESFKYKVGQASAYFDYKDLIPFGRIGSGNETDMLGLSADGELSLLISWGREGAEQKSWSGRGWGIYNKVFAPGDINRDGNIDLLARTPDGVLYLYPGSGNQDSPLKARIKVGAGWQAYDQLVGTNDINSDGIADLVARDFSGVLFAYLGTGSTSAPFKPRATIGSGWNAYNQIVGLDDYDGDGHGDMVARTVSGQAYIYKGNGNGGFKPRIKGSTGWNVATLFTQQGGNPDFGRNDLFARDSAGTLWWYYSKNNGTLSGRLKASDTGGWKGASITSGSSFTNENTSAILEQGSNGALYINGDYKGLGWGSYNALAAPGDLSNDGTGDLLGRDKSGNLYLFQGNGVGGTMNKIKIGGGWGVYNKLTGAGDLTGDGRADLLARDGSGNLYLYAGTGVPSAPFKPRVRIGWGYEGYKQLVVTGDLTGDGRADLVATDSAGVLWRYDSYGTGKLTSRTKIGTNYQIYPNQY